MYQAAAFRSWYHYTVSNTPSVSIIIPVYNEADQIKPCLAAIAKQTVMPDEVIVVDNNSTDGTAVLARQFPFVRVLTEHRQGAVHARNAGFDAAQSEIIGRIDADTILAPDWIESVQHLFVHGGPDAASGSVTYHGMVASRVLNKVDFGLRRYFAWALGREYALQGANMALRASAWRNSKKLMCNQGGIHEDFDLAIHLREVGFTTVFAPKMCASVTFRQAGSHWRDFTSYVLLHSGTYARHKRIRRVVMYPIMLLAFVFYPVLRILYLGYDEQSDGFSIAQLFRSQRKVRVNPATYVD